MYEVRLFVKLSHITTCVRVNLNGVRNDNIVRIRPWSHLIRGILSDSNLRIEIFNSESDYIVRVLFINGPELDLIKSPVLRPNFDCDHTRTPTQPDFDPI